MLDEIRRTYSIEIDDDFSDENPWSEMGIDELDVSTFFVTGFENMLQRNRDYQEEREDD